MRLKSLRGVVGRASNPLLSFLSYDSENKKKITKIRESLRERDKPWSLYSILQFSAHMKAVFV